MLKYGNYNLKQSSEDMRRKRYLKKMIAGGVLLLFLATRLCGIKNARFVGL